MDSMTYLDFAENDYKYFMHSYESGYVANNMAANAQNTAEKYLKHLIDNMTMMSKDLICERELYEHITYLS